jgi:GAF domain-containing protein
VNGNPSVEPGFNTEATVLHSALAAPLYGSQGVVGVLVLYHTQTDFFTAEHLAVLETQAADIGKTIEGSLSRQKSTDPIPSAGVNLTREDAKVKTASVSSGS